MSDRAQGAPLRHALVERLMHYYHFMAENHGVGGDARYTSNQIAKLVRMDDSLIRKDLAEVGVRGQPGYGFRSAEVLGAIREVLGFDKTSRAIIIGGGKLGGALASYHAFTHYGIEICGVFDIAPQKVGLMISSYETQPMASLPKVVRERNVSIAILTVPAEAAQTVAGQAVAAGVKALWNFANTSLVVPDTVIVRHEHMSVGLAELTYMIKQRGSTMAAP